MARFVKQQALSIRGHLARRPKQALFASTLEEVANEPCMLDKERVVLMRKSTFSQLILLLTSFLRSDRARKRLGIVQRDLPVAVSGFIRGSAVICHRTFTAPTLVYFLALLASPPAARSDRLRWAHRACYLSRLLRAHSRLVLRTTAPVVPCALAPDGPDLVMEARAWPRTPESTIAHAHANQGEPFDGGGRRFVRTGHMHEQLHPAPGRQHVPRPWLNACSPVPARRRAMQRASAGGRATQ